MCNTLSVALDWCACLSLCVSLFDCLSACVCALNRLTANVIGQMCVYACVCLCKQGEVKCGKLLGESRGFLSTFPELVLISGRENEKGWKLGGRDPA